MFVVSHLPSSSNVPKKPKTKRIVGVQCGQGRDMNSCCVGVQAVVSVWDVASETFKMMGKTEMDVAGYAVLFVADLR